MVLTVMLSAAECRRRRADRHLLPRADALPAALQSFSSCWQDAADHRQAQQMRHVIADAPYLDAETQDVIVAALKDALQTAG